MKTRNGFVSNSSSSSFMINNKSNRTLTIVDFARENPQIVEEFKREYGDEDVTQEQVIADAERRMVESDTDYTFLPNTQKPVVFGDEQGDVIGRVYDYALRNGGESRNFRWAYFESLR